MRKAVICFFNIMLVLQLAGCGKTAEQTKQEAPETVAESVLQEEAAKDGAAEDSAADNIEENAAEDGAADYAGEDAAKENAAEKGTIEEDTEEEESGEPSGAENKYYSADDQYIEDDETKYGTVKKEQEEFYDQDGIKSFYYDMDCFYFDETYPAVVKETLQTYYDGKKENYRLDAENYSIESYGEPHIPYDRLLFFYVTYAGDDYVSLVFNDVCYMGGAHPESWMEGITIDCSTGEMVDASRFTDDSAEETGAQIQAVLGEDFIYTPEHWSYYITDESVVFFYYNPRFWDQVATKRVR